MTTKDPFDRPGRTVVQVGKHPLPELGPKFYLQIILVTYGPGVTFPPHYERHSQWGTIVSGELVIGVDTPDMPESERGKNRTMKKGDSWAEPAGAFHRYTKNESDKDVTYFVHTIREEGVEGIIWPEEKSKL